MPRILSPIRRMAAIAAAAMAMVLLAAAPAVANPRPVATTDTDCVAGGWVAILTLTNTTGSVMVVSTVNPPMAGITAGMAIPAGGSATGTRMLPNSVTTQAVAVTGGPLLPWLVVARFDRPTCYYPGR